MNDTQTPRPNVATGAFMGFFTMVLGLLLTALQTKRWFQYLLRKRLKHTREQASSRKASWISERRS